MAVVVSLQELVDELKIMTDEHHVFLSYRLSTGLLRLSHACSPCVT